MRTISRSAEPAYQRINAEAAALATQADLALLRSLLRRCERYLEEVAQEARIDGEPDACAEDLRRDIRIVMFGQ